MNNQRAADLSAARSLFETNLDAIRQRDRATYLSTYWQSESLARSGATGMQLGYSGHASGASDDTWPDVFQAQNIQLNWLKPGVVYATYRYRVSYGTNESNGISERVFLKTDEGWRIAVTTAFQALPGQPPPPLVLSGATLYDDAHSNGLENSVIIVRNGRFDCVGTSEECPLPDDVEVFDLTGHWVTPGLIDSHVHFSQTGWIDGRPDVFDHRLEYSYELTQFELQSKPERFFRAFLASGVTGVFDVGGYPWTWDLRDSLRTDGPWVAATGPLLSTLDHWLNLPSQKQFIYLDSDSTARDAVRDLAAHSTDAIKIWLIPSRDLEELKPLVLAAASEAQKLGIPLVVHATGLAEAKLALRAGAKILVHSVQDSLIDDVFLQLAKDAGASYCPTLTVLQGYLNLSTAMINKIAPTLDDPHACIDVELKQRMRSSNKLDDPRLSSKVLDQQRQAIHGLIDTMRQNLKTIHEAGIPIIMGTDAGNPLTPHGPSVYAEMEAMQEAGLSATTILRAATSNAARALGRLNDVGTLERGKLADLLVLDADPSKDIKNLRQLSRVMRRGELRDIKEFKTH